MESWFPAKRYPAASWLERPPTVWAEASVQLLSTCNYTTRYFMRIEKIEFGLPIKWTVLSARWWKTVAEPPHSPLPNNLSLKICEPVT